jgi:parvulin-like peptidyl-prolyl isomerase
MRPVLPFACALATLGAVCPPILSQERPAGSADSRVSAPATAVAATVNGQPIPEIALARSLRGVPAAKQAEARKEILDYFIDNVLLDQYLQQVRVEVAAQDVDARFRELRDGVIKNGQTFEKFLEQTMLTEELLRAEITAFLRWEKYCEAQINDKELRDLFNKNQEMFDGSMVRARHILLTPPTGDAQAAERGKQRLTQFKEQVEAEAAKGLAQLPQGTDNLAREQTRCRLYEDAFAALARRESACPSKEQGGDLGWFPRSGSMVEPFASAAFALKPYTLSDVVATPFGYHLILLTGRRPGKETKFDDVKEVVREAYCDRLRESLCSKLRPQAKIVIHQAKP